MAYLPGVGSGQVRQKAAEDGKEKKQQRLHFFFFFRERFSRR